MKKTQFIVFSQPYKTPNGSKEKEEYKKAWFSNSGLLEVLAQRFVWFSENDVRPRVIQAGRIGERVGREVILIELPLYHLWPRGLVGFIFVFIYCRGLRPDRRGKIKVLRFVALSLLL